jgi:hypothetical protein
VAQNGRRRALGYDVGRGPELMLPAPVAAPARNSQIGAGLLSRPPKKTCDINVFRFLGSMEPKKLSLGAGAHQIGAVSPASRARWTPPRTVRGILSQKSASHRLLSQMSNKV